MYHPRLQGSHYNMGLKYGKILFESGVNFDSMIRLDTHQLEFGYESLEICRRTYPEIVDEVKGMADGLKFSFDQFAAFLLTMGVFTYDHGCTAFCYKREGEIIFARNHDMFSQYRKTTQSSLYRPDVGYFFLGQSDALIGVEDGVNEHGLAAGITYIAPKTIKPGMNFLLVVRYLLEKCSTVQEAIKALKALPLSSTQQVLLADKTGAMAAIECCPEKVILRSPESGENFILASNHFVHPQMADFDGSPMNNWYHSRTRYETVYRALKNHDKLYSINYGKDILSGKHGFLCQYDKKTNFDTLWSFIVRLNDLKVCRAEGNPGRRGFEEDNRLHWALGKRDDKGSCAASG